VAETKKQGGDGSTLQAVLEKKSEVIPFEIIEEERLPGSRIRFKLKMTEEAIASRLAEALKEVSRQVQIPGFRPGKAPKNLVKKKYEPYAREETVKRLVPRLAELYTEQQSLEGISQPYLLEWTSDAKEGTMVELALEIQPEIEINAETLNGLEVEVHTIKVDESYIEKSLEGLRARNATYEPTEDGYVTKDGLLFTCEVTDADGGVVAERSVKEYYSTRIEEEVPEEVAVALVGKKKGESLSMDLEEDSELEPGKKEKVHYEFELLEVKKRILPELDDDFAIDVNEKYENLDALKKGVAEDAAKGEVDRQRDEVIAEVYNVLSERLDFDLPRALVEQTANRSLSDMEKRLNQYGMSLRQMDQNVVQNYAVSMQVQARQNVKNYLISRQVSKLFEVMPTEEDINAELERIAAQSGRKPLAIRAQLEAKKQWDQFVEDLTLKVTNDKIIEKATVKTKEVTAAEFEEIQKKRQEEQAAKLQGLQAKAAAEAADEVVAEIESDSKE
jgi:trigger factor